jgi:hypothetical protein
MVSVLGTEMEHLDKNKKNNAKVTAATLYRLTATTILVAGIAATAPLSLQLAYAPTCTRCGFVPVVVSGDNIYIGWWTNNTENGNEEVMFRASNDAGQTFSDKINLSNSSQANSSRVEIAGEGDTVNVSWWETNQTSDIPVARISTDAGETFGPMLRLGTNGTRTNTEEGGEGGETTEEEAVGGAEVAE